MPAEVANQEDEKTKLKAIRQGKVFKTLPRPPCPHDSSFLQSNSTLRIQIFPMTSTHLFCDTFNVFHINERNDADSCGRFTPKSLTIGFPSRPLLRSSACASSSL